jgi:two-component system sensor kinase FixL
MASFSHEVKGVKKSGEEFPANISVNRIDNAVENQFVIIIRDLSAERAAEKEAREQRELLAHADRLNTLGEMAAGIAHEMNQPLTAISMYAKSGQRFLKGGAPKMDRLNDALVRLDAQAMRAGAVMERMQSMTKQRDSEQETVDTEFLLKEVHRLAEVEARIRNFVIELRVCNDLPKVRCDPIQIQQVILNLLRNGMESMTSAGRAYNERIVLSCEESSYGVEISIEDCGCGISVELARKLYQPFTSTKESGMGLGLSISRSIVAAHGGQLLHANNKRGGATFSFSLPRV